LFVDASGQVGVGVAAPSSVLEVSQSVNGNAFAIVANSNPGTGAIAALSASNGTSNAVFGIGGTGYAQYGQIRPGGAAIYTSSAAGIGLSADNASGYISFGTGSGASERMRLDSSGRLGLGTSAPPALFSAHSTDTSADFFIGEFQSTANPTGLSNTYVKFEKGDGYGGAVGGFVEQGVGSGLKLAALNTGTLTDVVTIRHTGLVGIGTTSPGTALDVVGVIRSKAAGGEGGQITLTDVSNTEVFNVDVDNAGIIRLFSTVSNKDIQFGQLVGTGCNINFYTGQLERARIDSSGRLLVGTSSITLGSPQAIIEKSTSDLDILRVQCGALETSSNLAGIAFGHGPSGSRPKVAIASVATGSFGRGSLAFFIDQVGDNNSVSSTDEVARIDSSGRVGIGTTSPGAALQVAGSSTVSSQANVAAKVGAAVTSDLLLGSLNGNSPFVASEGAYPLLFITNANERARIDSSGRLLVGTSASISTAALGNAQVQVAGNSNETSQLSISRFSANNDRPRLHFIKSRGALGVNTIVQADDSLGQIAFAGADGTNYPIGANIGAEVDGTPGANDMPGRLVFSTTADGASNATERVRITSGGYFKASNDGTYLSSTSTEHEFRQSTASNSDIVAHATNASFVSSVYYARATRAGNSAYNFFVGNSGDGTDNEFILRGDGQAYADGSWNGGGADYAEYFEWSDGNPDADDRRGIAVVLDGEKIRPALAGEDPIGVISGNPSVVGDSAWNKWSGKYLRDDYGTYILEDYEVTDEEGSTVVQQRRKLNPAYDPDVEYTSREERPEWDCVGLMGKLRLRKGQPTGSRWIKMRDISDSVEEWLVR
jgi:hypothetical protein